MVIQSFQAPSQCENHVYDVQEVSGAVMNANHQLATCRSEHAALRVQTYWVQDTMTTGENLFGFLQSLKRKQKPNKFNEYIYIYI